MTIRHLWQSTLFALAVGLVTLAFRRQEARVRYWLWFSASLKFLIPFSLLMVAGSLLPWGSSVRALAAPVVSMVASYVGPAGASLGAPSVSGAIDAQLFERGTGASGATAAVASATRATGWLSLIAFAVWACGFATIALMRLQSWRRVRSILQASTVVETPSIGLPPGVQVRAAPGLLEPGVVGIWRPVLLLPADIETQLPPEQFEAIVAHELCHIRYRDNFTAALHMLVEATFWFHPLVWWIGARLVEQRERACDEEVLRGSANPRAYADGILHVCKRYVDARLACVSGVSGADLQKRIAAIMSGCPSYRTARVRKIMLGAAAMLTIVLPVGAGVLLQAPLLRAQSVAASASPMAFEVAWIRPNRSDDSLKRFAREPGGRLAGTNVTLNWFIGYAYDLSKFQVLGGPDWLDADRFDLLAEAEGDPSVPQMRLMLRQLLADRFKLRVHTDTRTLPIYALMTARSDGGLGPHLRRTETNCAAAAPSEWPSPTYRPCGFFGYSPSARGGYAFRGLTLVALAKVLAPVLQRHVSDRTGLAGYFDGDFDSFAELPPHSRRSGEPASIFSVLPAQLGLTLKPQEGPVEVLVIDAAERPTEH